MTKINPDIDTILDASSYDDETKDLVRQVLAVELQYANKSNYHAENEIVQLVEDELMASDD